LLVSEPLSGGVGRHVVDLAQGLSRLGHEVHLIHSPFRASPSLVERLRSVPAVRCAELPMRRNPHVSDASAVRAIRRYLLQNGRFDVVHGHSSKGGALARLAGVGTDAVKVYTPHAFVTLTPGLNPIKRRLFGAAERWLARLGDAVIAVSEDERDHAVELGLPTDRLFVVPNGIDQPPFPCRNQVRHDLGLPGEALCLGFVGRLVYQKAPDALVRCLGPLAPKYPWLRLIVVGEGPLEDQARRLATRLGVQGRILWLGERDGCRIMPAFDVFALSSRYEGLPYVLLEAMSCGLPTVATRVGGVSTLIRDGVHGLIVDGGDLPGFARAVGRLLDDASLRNRMGEASREAACGFTLERMVQGVLGVYRQQISRHGQRPSNSRKPPLRFWYTAREPAS
jgi:glycosyltransferase involved in cell wall biosynthesis